MLNIAEVEDEIKRFEDKELTRSNCETLASLYIIRHFYMNQPVNVIQEDKVIDEYEDILPSYSRYKQMKLKFQMNEVPKEAVQESIGLLCKEIQEFIHTLYISSDMEEERVIIAAIYREGV